MIPNATRSPEGSARTRTERSGAVFAGKLIPAKGIDDIIGISDQHNARDPGTCLGGPRLQFCVAFEYLFSESSRPEMLTRMEEQVRKE